MKAAGAARLKEERSRSIRCQACFAFESDCMEVVPPSSPSGNYSVGGMRIPWLWSARPSRASPPPSSVPGNGSRGNFSVLPGSHNDSPNMQDIQLAYALTVHKAHSFMHHCNLFYTGVTRAKEPAVVIGDRWGISNCAKRRRQDDRKTFLLLLLAQAPRDAVCSLSGC